MLLNQTLVPKVFQELALRYKDRQGGYTRINKFGRREGDNAPSAILELVGGPRDTLFEMTARAIGWEIIGHKLRCEQLRSHAMDDLETGVESIDIDGTEKWLRPITRENVQKVLLHRGEEGKKLLGQKAAAYIVRISPPLPRLSSRLNFCTSRTKSLRSLMLTMG
jgi:large subunit ribosomal protein L17